MRSFRLSIDASALHGALRLAVYTLNVIARYVHIEVRQLLRGATLSHAEAECAVTLPTGETATVFANLRSDRAPFWRVVSIDDFEDPFVARAIETIGEDALCERIANAATLWNLWDSLRAKDLPYTEGE